MNCDDSLYDEQGNEIPAEVDQRVQDSDDDGSDQGAKALATPVR